MHSHEACILTMAVKSLGLEKKRWVIMETKTNATSSRMTINQEKIVIPLKKLILPSAL